MSNKKKNLCKANVYLASAAATLVINVTPQWSINKKVAGTVTQQEHRDAIKHLRS